MEAVAGSASASGPAAAASSGNRGPFMLNLPPGFHFAPTEDELVVDYLRRKIAGLPPPLPIFKDLCINSYRPEQIVEKYREYGENKWYVFTMRKRKYATGNRPDRTTPGKGFWKATGAQRKIHSGGKLVGRRRTLVFYTRPEKGEEEDEGAPAPEEMDEDIEETALSKLVKTNWIMHEYENLKSEAEAADKNIDKIGEWVLCTIHKSQRCDDEKKGKKKEGKEGSTAGGIGTVEGSSGSGDGDEGSRAGGKKRKRKEKINANKGIDQIRQADHPRKRSKTPMPPQEQPHSNTVAPASEGDDHNIAPNMGMVEYTSHPMERSPVPMQPYEPPHSDSEMMTPSIGDDYCIGPHMVPARWQEPPHSEETMFHNEMMFPPVGGSYNIGSGSNMMPMAWQQGPPLSEMISPLLGDTYSSIAPDMVPTPSQESTHYSEMTSPHVGGNYNMCPNMATYQHTNYLQPDAAVPPQVYGGVAQSHNMAGRSNDGDAFDGLLGAGNNGHSYPLRSYAAGTNTLAMFMNNGVTSHNHGGFFAGYQYHGAPSVYGPSRVVDPRPRRRGRIS